ncbi:hypothetical protein ACLB2K_019922 [Fragaria x ananassa]
MVSLRRRRLLGLCSGRSSFLTPLPLFCDNAKPDSVHPMPSKDRNLPDGSGAKTEPLSSPAYGSSLAKEQPQKYSPGPPIKRRKRHRRKHIHNQEPCLMRGVYFKNMKWQAAIKVDKKQIHLGTVGSQEEAAHLYDRAAFMCGREPNFELPEEEKQELMKFKWDEFLAVTRHSINNKKLKKWQWSASGKRSETPPLQDGDWDDNQEVNVLSTSEDGGGRQTSP